MAIDRGIARLEDCALERALTGEERPVVSQGKLVTTYTRYDTQLILFFLRQRLHHRYGEISDPKPGSPLFERVRLAIEREAPDPEAILDSINAKLDRMRERAEAQAGRSGEA
ncbi:MAG: hypothetical protein R3D89_12535 [Sphingomonadaceae bacterium]|jgi:hypothetical protein